MKFVLDGDAITLTAAPDRSEKLGECLKFVVSDTGIGIGPAELGWVLEPFGKGARTS